VHTQSEAVVGLSNTATIIAVVVFVTQQPPVAAARVRAEKREWKSEPWERDRESEHYSQRERESVCVCVRERERECVCVCAFV
jgi:hypothetical protein